MHYPSNSSFALRRVRTIGGVARRSHAAVAPAELALLGGVTHSEGNSGTTVYTFGVNRLVNTAGMTTVDWVVTGSGANPANPADFIGGVFPSGTLTFADGETTKNITVNVSGDATPEPQETFTVTLSNASGGATITQATATGAIADDDSDASFSSVKLLLGFNGVDGATTTSDESSAAHAVSLVGNAQLDTAQAKFGASSLLLDGTGDTLSSVDSADWAFGAGSWTLEGWFRFAAASADTMLMGQWQPTGNQRALRLDRHFTSNGLRIQYSDTGGTAASLTGSTTITTGVWYHIAADYDVTSQTMRIYKDGVMVAKLVGARTIFNSNAAFTIGGDANAASNHNGWVDEVRVTKGVARYASDAGYTVPTTAFPRG